MGRVAFDYNQLPQGVFGNQTTFNNMPSGAVQANNNAFGMGRFNNMFSPQSTQTFQPYNAMQGLSGYIDRWQNNPQQAMQMAAKQMASTQQAPQYDFTGKRLMDIIASNPEDVANITKAYMEQVKPDYDSNPMLKKMNRFDEKKGWVDYQGNPLKDMNGKTGVGFTDEEIEAYREGQKQGLEQLTGGSSDVGYVDNRISSSSGGGSSYGGSSSSTGDSGAGQEQGLVANIKNLTAEDFIKSRALESLFNDSKLRDFSDALKLGTPYRPQLPDGQSYNMPHGGQYSMTPNDSGQYLSMPYGGQYNTIGR